MIYMKDRIDKASVSGLDKRGREETFITKRVILLSTAQENSPFHTRVKLITKIVIRGVILFTFFEPPLSRKRYR